MLPTPAASRAEVLIATAAPMTGSVAWSGEQYQRGAETVYPTGAFVKGGEYGTDVSFPVPQSEENNPSYQPAACVTSRA